MKLLEWTELKHFRADEVEGPDKMSRAFMVKLDRARDLVEGPWKINSSWRNGGGSHSEGVAVDIAVTTSRKRYKVLKALLDVGFKRIGVYDRHIHVDDSERLDSEVIWIGVSQ